MSTDTQELHELHWMMEMLHNIDVGLVVLNRDYQVQIWNGFMENHSGLKPAEAKDQVLFDLFDEIDVDWFKRKVESVYLLKNKAFTIWEQRPYVFKFQNYQPITGSAEHMYQNTTFIPLMSADGAVTHLCLLIYDETGAAVGKQHLEESNEHLAILSQTDGLTKLFNRTHWEKCLSAEFKRWKRSQHVSSLVMLDIDHFKKVNDGYGHVVGDEVIKHISQLISLHTRETDMAGRYGGEEFAVILTDTLLDEAYVFAERLRVEVEKAMVKYNDIELKYTVSLGVAEVSEEIISYESWIERADEALYHSKENGRNQVSLYGR